MVREYGIHSHDVNFDETGYRVGMARNDWAIVVDSTRTVYLKCPNIRELLLAIECINAEGCESPLFLIITGTNILTPWFVIGLNPHVAVTNSEIGLNND